MNRLIVILLLALGAAALLRVPDLGNRPMHNDEAVNGIIFGKLWEKGQYTYDPNEHHGPSLLYATLAFNRLTGGPGIDELSEARLRWVAALFGLALLLVLPLLHDALGRNGTIWAGVFTAVSPALVFYSRYYIHEMLLVFFAFLAIAAGWRYWIGRRPFWAVVAGVSLGMMHATKETFVISLAAGAMAAVGNQLWNRYLDAAGTPAKAPRARSWHLAAGLAGWGVVFVLFFTSFFSNWAGIADSVRTYIPWLHRAGGDSPHIQPWYFYLHRLVWFHPGAGPPWTELMLIALAAVGGVSGFHRKSLAEANAGFLRFLGLYTVLAGVLYSLISYKTPWCLLNFWQPAVVLAGAGAAVLVRACGNRWQSAAFAALVLAGTGHLAWEAWQLSFRHEADRRNPYVYAQTSADILRLVQKVEQVAAASPQARQVLIKVMAADGDYWPLPWYLRSFRKVGWWDQVTADPYAPIMIVSARWQAGLDERKTHLMPGLFELRPGVFLELYVELELWKAYLSLHPTPPSE